MSRDVSVHTYVEHSNVLSELVSESFKRISNFGASRNINILRFLEDDDDDDPLLRRRRSRERESERENGISFDVSFPFEEKRFHDGAMIICYVMM